ncbi:MAG TPA: aspartyl protease family protein [Methylomirabilota bacterium]|jgi:hypothetical protein
MARGATLMIAATLLAMILAPVPAAAILYRWTDDNGVIHYTAEIQTVPVARRSRVREIPTPQPRNAPPPAEEEQVVAETGTPNTVVKITPGAPIVLPARLNGVPLTLAIDTGADRTVLSPTAMARAGLPVSGPEITITGVTGATTALLGTVPLLDIAGTRVGPLSVVVHDAGLQGTDGLLGRDVLDAFTVTLDSGRGQAIVTPR